MRQWYKSSWYRNATILNGSSRTIAGIFQNIKLQEKIDQRIRSNDPGRVINHGQAVIAMILNGLGFSHRRLYLMFHFPIVLFDRDRYYIKSTVKFIETN